MWVSMARNGLKSVYQMLDNIQKLQGTKYRVVVTIQSNGERKDKDPAYYGSLLERGTDRINASGRYYKFLEPGLRNFSTKLVHSNDFKEYMEMVRADGKRRGKKEMIKASEWYGRKAVDSVRDYILYDAPQYPERRRKNPSLLDTWNLYDSLVYRVYDKNNNLVAQGD